LWEANVFPARGPCSADLKRETSFVNPERVEYTQKGFFHSIATPRVHPSNEGDHLFIGGVCETPATQLHVCASSLMEGNLRLAAALSVMVALSGAALAQSPSSNNSVYLELLGNGLVYSCNYDHLFAESFGARVGLGYIPLESHSVVTFPLMGYYLVGSGNSRLELGLGACVFLQPESVSFSFMAAANEEVRGNAVLATATVGYRYQRADGGFVFRAGVTPFFGKFIRDNSTPTMLQEESVLAFRWSAGMSLGFGL
jgi:hypothetical protein